nr:hypothetical protein BaRGS_016902 [Batillaria attramentaria]
MQDSLELDGWLGLIVAGKLFYDFSDKKPFEEVIKALIAGILRGEPTNVPSTHAGWKQRVLDWSRDRVHTLLVNEGMDESVYVDYFCYYDCYYYCYCCYYNYNCYYYYYYCYNNNNNNYYCYYCCYYYCYYYCCHYNYYCYYNYCYYNYCYYNYCYYNYRPIRLGQTRLSRTSDTSKQKLFPGQTCSLYD